MKNPTNGGRRGRHRRRWIVAGLLLGLPALVVPYVLFVKEDSQAATIDGGAYYRLTAADSLHGGTGELRERAVADAVAGGADWWVIGRALRLHPQAVFERYRRNRGERSTFPSSLAPADTAGHPAGMGPTAKSPAGRARRAATARRGRPEAVRNFRNHQVVIRPPFGSVDAGSTWPNHARFNLGNVPLVQSSPRHDFRNISGNC